MLVTSILRVWAFIGSIQSDIISWHMACHRRREMESAVRKSLRVRSQRNNLQGLRMGDANHDAWEGFGRS